MNCCYQASNNKDWTISQHFLERSQNVNH